MSAGLGLNRLCLLSQAAILCLLGTAAADAQGTLTIGTTELPRGSVGAPYSFSLNAAGGTQPYFWTVTGTPPPGLIISPAGIISGTPSATGSYTVTPQVFDASGKTAVRSFPLTIDGQGILITAAALPPATAGQNYLHVLSAAGGTAPYRWAITGLPEGLRLDGSTGTISGIPRVAGTFALQTKVSDEKQLSGTKELTITVNVGPLHITTVSPLFAGTAGVSYAQVFSAIGGTGAYRWSVASGDTGGLTLDPASGTLQGVPRQAGTFVFTVQVSDGSGGSASQSYSIVVNGPALTIVNGSSLPAAAEGVNYSRTFSVAGGTPPYQWSASGGIPGLSFDPASVTLAGKPTTGGTYSWSLNVRDAAGLSTTKAFTIFVSGSSLKITTAPQLPDVNLGESVSFAVAGSGGAPPYQWSANGLPDGLTVNATTGVISGTVQGAGTYSFTVRVTDSTRATAVDLFRVLVRLPVVPGVTISGLPESAGAAEQFAMKIALENGYVAAVAGQAILSFAPDAGPGDSTIQFATGGRTIDFTIPAGSQEAVFSGLPAIQTGTVAGVITVALRLTSGGVEITPPRPPAASIRIDRGAPAIREARVTRSGNTLTVEVTGFSTAREVTQATFAFSTAAGEPLQDATVTVPVEDLFNQWYREPANGQYGSQFVFVQPFTVRGNASAVSVRSITLTNRAGSVSANPAP